MPGKARHLLALAVCNAVESPDRTRPSHVFGRAAEANAKDSPRLRIESGCRNRAPPGAICRAHRVIEATRQFDIPVLACEQDAHSRLVPERIVDLASDDLNRIGEIKN